MGMTSINRPIICKIRWKINRTSNCLVKILTLTAQDKSALVSGGDRDFSCVAPRLWNQLPDYIKNLNNLQHFKCALKTHLFQRAYFT